MKELSRTYLARLFALIVIFGAALWLTYDHFTHPAFVAWEDREMMKGRLAGIIEETVSERNVMAMQRYVLKNTFNGRSEQLQQYLFHSISSVCDSLLVAFSDFSSVHDDALESIRVVTTKATVQGEFKQILKMIYAIETTVDGVKVSGATFYLRTDRQAKTSRLYCDIYLQSIIRKT